MEQLIADYPGILKVADFTQLAERTLGPYETVLQDFVESTYPTGAGGE